jgi:hypothetical protein
MGIVLHLITLELAELPSARLPLQSSRSHDGRGRTFDRRGFMKSPLHVEFE